VKWNVYKGS